MGSPANCRDRTHPPPRHARPPQDPTGSVGGTLTKAVLEAEPDLRQGAVLRLRRVTVLRTPPPRSISHLCITLDAVVQVVPAPGGRQAGTAAQHGQPQALPQTLPALPAPPAAQPAASLLSQPLQLPQRLQQQQQQHPRADLGLPGAAAAAPAPSGPAGMPPPLPRQPAAAAASASFGWPSLAAGQQQPGMRPPRQQQQQRQQSSSFAWPSLGLPPAPRPQQPQQGAQQPGGGQQPALPAGSVNFSINFSEAPAPWDQPAWQDDACSKPLGQGGATAGKAAVRAWPPQQDAPPGGCEAGDDVPASQDMPSQQLQQTQGGNAGWLQVGGPGVGGWVGLCPNNPLHVLAFVVQSRSGDAPMSQKGC